MFGRKKQEEEGPSFGERALLVTFLQRQIDDADIPDDLRQQYQAELNAQQEILSNDIKDTIVVVAKGAAILVTIVVIMGVAIVVWSGNDEEAESEDSASSETPDTEQSPS
jgi:hypothetical protein